MSDITVTDKARAAATAYICDAAVATDPSGTLLLQAFARFERDILARHRTQAAGEPVAWMAIDSAPRDGTCILVCDANLASGFQQVVDWDADSPAAGWHWRTAEGVSYHAESFTHWQPLPHPPTSTPATDQSERADVAALVEAAKEAADIFDGMCDDEINEEFMPRLRQALAPFTKGQP